MYAFAASAPDPLGVTPDGRGGANVALWAPGATAVYLCVFDDSGIERRVELRDRTFAVFHDHVAELPHGTRYGFRVDGPWEPERGQRFNPHKLLIDPYARAIEGSLRMDPALFGHVGTDDLLRNDADSAPFVPRSIVVDLDFDWMGVQSPRTPWTDTVIYEAHVTGLTKLHPDVPPHQRGTFAGAAHPSVIAHLKSIGVTAIELLPSQKFLDETHLLSQGRTDYWGYNTIGFFAPHDAYSSSGTRGEQVQEFRNMVKSFHEAGIEVILDVVYNHTAEGSELGPTLAFRGIANREYYRLAGEGRHYNDFTGCGNTLNSANPHVLQLIMDSLRYWVTEMHVDGFRFDLASALARAAFDVDMLGTFLTTIQQDPVLRRVKLIAEPWDIGPGGYQVGDFPPLWTEWNDRYRDTLRDFWRGANGIGELGWRLSGSADLYASEGRRPYASINFITAHDGFTMRDVNSYDHKHNLANGEENRDGTDNNRSRNYGAEGETREASINAVRQRQIRNMLATLFLSTGVPMITAGDELGRTQRGNNNAYCQDNEISWVSWSLQEWQRDLLEFARSAARLRTEHPAFRQRYFFDGRPMTEGGPKDVAWLSPEGTEVQNEAWSDPGCHSLGMFIAGEIEMRGARTVHDTSFLVLLHAGEEPIDFRLPTEPYGREFARILDSEEPARADGRVCAAGTTVRMQSRSLMVFEVRH